MFQKSSLSLLTALLSVGIPASGVMLVLDQDSLCGNTEKVMRGSLRHIEGSGIGYAEGYTTLDLFLAPFQPIKDVWLPFIDLRGHVFNNATYAGNLGIGARAFKQQVWGVNLYYDTRSTKKQFYHQLGAGVEVLGKILDFRLNGYLPFGDEEGRRTHLAMGGLNAEVGWKENKISDMPLYLAAGPYYFRAKNLNALGGQARFKVDLFKYIGVEGIFSYDPVFHFNVQGQLSLTIPFGPRQQVKRRDALTCRQTVSQWKAALQSVSRYEIIVLDRKGNGRGSKHSSGSDGDEQGDSSEMARVIQKKWDVWKTKEEHFKTQFAQRPST